jgi:hypothetical protein
MRDLLITRASPLKHQSKPEPDCMQVVQRLETYLSGQAGIAISNLHLEEEVRERSLRAEEYRSFTTPFEAAQLRSPGFGRALSDDRMQDTAVWVRMTRLPMSSCMLSVGLIESIPVYVAEETTSSTRGWAGQIRHPHVTRGSGASSDLQSTTKPMEELISQATTISHPRRRWYNRSLPKRRSSEADNTRLVGL